MTNEKFLEQLNNYLLADQIYSDSADCNAYSYDNSKQPAYLPQFVVFPKSQLDVINIIQCCYDHIVPIVPRGSGTGTVGGSLATQGGVILSFERMSAVIDIDPKNRIMIVEPGVTNQQVQNLAKKEGFFFAPDPSSRAICTIGGNIAHNSSGPRAVKYGSTRENTLGLSAVNGKAEKFNTGYFTSKGSVGYDLTRLLIGSEGTLAAVTKATLKLIPLPEDKRMLRFYFSSLQSATDAVTNIMATSVTPCALEFMDNSCIENIKKNTDLDFPCNTEALLMVEVDGIKESLNSACKKIIKAATNTGLLDYQFARNESETEAFWAMRKALSPSLRKIAPKKINEDVAVPVAQLPQLIIGVKKIAEEFNIKTANFGHAGNGNIHINLLVDQDNKNEMQRAELCLDRIFDLVVDLKGTLSGEHGVGIMKKPFIHKELDNVQIHLMKNIKKQFDPLNIMNPGKIW